MQNLVGQSRPSSLFSTYQPQTDSQQEALTRLVSLADAASRKLQALPGRPHPFSNGRIVFISGPTGVGKSHLVEAFINDLAEKELEVAKTVFLFRGDFTSRNVSGLDQFGNCPIVVIDDLYAKYQSIEQVHGGTDIKILMQLVTMVYEDRRLVIITSNFPLMQGISEKIRQEDQIGRVTSRLNELMANSGELVIEGADYREKLAASKTADDIFGNL